MAKTMLLFYLFLCILCVARGSEIICEVGFCRAYNFDVGCASPAVECSINNATHAGMTMPSPTTCNCCDFCLPFYGEDQYCSRGGPGTGFTVGRCGDGLTCVADASDGHSYCTRLESKCHSAQDDYDMRLDRGEVGALEMRPHCDGKGKYAAYDCVPAQTCFCQSEEGERIFGEVLYLGTVTTQNMHCGCSRLHDKIRQTIAPGVPYPVIGPRCTADGNFNPVQCIDRICYCVDRGTGQILEGEGRRVDLEERPLTDLSCYDSTLDLFPHLSIGEPPFNYTTACIEDMDARIEIILESIEEGFNVQYYTSVPECMPDGTYGRVVTRASGEKVCVDERGHQIEHYHATPSTSEFDSMNCKCAQTNLIMATSTEKPVCCKNGNFRRIQCRRGFCHCVDSDGRQAEKESEDVTKLSCYTPDWRTC